MKFEENAIYRRQKIKLAAAGQTLKTAEAPAWRGFQPCAFRLAS
jgi:hypothetical protein